jgi:hypothetical protein
LKEVLGYCSKRAVKEVESVEKKSILEQPKRGNNKWQQKANRLRKVQNETNPATTYFGKGIA